MFAHAFLTTLRTQSQSQSVEPRPAAALEKKRMQISPDAAHLRTLTIFKRQRGMAYPSWFR